MRAGADDQAATASRTLSAAVPLAWLGADDVQVRAKNADGTVQYTADVANGTGAPVTVSLAAPDTPAWHAADLPGRTSVGESASLVVDVNAPAVPASMLVLSQERLLVGSGGEAVVSRPPSAVALALDGQTIAPVVPEAAVAQCVFDPKSDTSSAGATLTYDNSASTLPVAFAVDGHPGLAQTVPAHARAEVELPRRAPRPRPTRSGPTATRSSRAWSTASTASSGPSRAPRRRAGRRRPGRSSSKARSATTTQWRR